MKTRVEEIQVGNCFFPPTNLEEPVNRFKSYFKATRMYNGLQEYVEHATDFYRELDSPETTEILLNEAKPPERQR